MEKAHSSGLKGDIRPFSGEGVGKRRLQVEIVVSLLETEHGQGDDVLQEKR